MGGGTLSGQCGFKWKAPYQHAPPSKKVSYVAQVCVLPTAHEGVHRSVTNVTSEAKA